jgi:hypothetical protein
MEPEGLLPHSEEPATCPYRVHIGVVIIKTDPSVTQQSACQRRTLPKLWINYLYNWVSSVQLGHLFADSEKQLTNTKES